MKTGELLELKVGEKICRFDLFKKIDGCYMKIDNLGMVLGVPVIGKEIEKEGDWFRRPNVKALTSLPGGNLNTQ